MLDTITKIVPFAVRASGNSLGRKAILRTGQLSGCLMSKIHSSYDAGGIRSAVNAVNAWQCSRRGSDIKIYRNVYPVTGKPSNICMKRLIYDYNVFLCDLYGVFENGSGILKGAVNAIKYMRSGEKKMYFVSNTADWSRQKIADKWGQISQDPDITISDVYTSGMMLTDYATSRDLIGKKALVLGNDDSLQYVRSAGMIPVEQDNYHDAESIILAHTSGYEYKEGFLSAVNLYLQNLREKHLEIPVVVVNTDIIAPRSERDVTITGGSIGLHMEAILQSQGIHPKIDRLGKPELFKWAIAKENGFPGRKVLAVGDSLVYDILGARMAGIDSLLVLSGTHKLNGDIYKLDKVMQSNNIYPTYILPSVEI